MTHGRNATLQLGQQERQVSLAGVRGTCRPYLPALSAGVYPSSHLILLLGWNSDQDSSPRFAVSLCTCRTASFLFILHQDSAFPPLVYFSRLLLLHICHPAP